MAGAHRPSTPGRDPRTLGVVNVIKYSKLVPLVRAIDGEVGADHIRALRVLLPGPHDDATTADAKARDYLGALIAVRREHWPESLYGIRAAAEILLTRC